MIPYAPTHVPVSRTQVIETLRAALDADAALDTLVDSVHAYAAPEQPPWSAGTSYALVVVRLPVSHGAAGLGGGRLAFSGTEGVYVQALVETNDAGPGDNPRRRLELVHAIVGRVIRETAVGVLPPELVEVPAVPIWDSVRQSFTSTALYRIVAEPDVVSA